MPAPFYIFIIIKSRRPLKQIPVINIGTKEEHIFIRLTLPKRGKFRYRVGMAMDSRTIHSLITQAIPDATVRIDDLRGDGDHYAAHIESPAFAGKTRIQQHQMVYAALKGKMGNELHALQIRTSTPHQ